MLRAGRQFSTARGNPYAACTRKLDTPLGEKRHFSLHELGEDATVRALPVCIRVLLESAMRNCDGTAVTEADVQTILNWCSRCV